MMTALGIIIRLAQVFLVLCTVVGYTPILKRQDMCGIWKLSKPNLNLPSSSESKTKNDDEEVILRLNDDGTFDPYTTVPTENAPLDDLHGILGRGGCWEYRDKTLILAADRPENTNSSKVHDTLLMGKLDIQVSACLATDDDASSAMGNDDEQQIPEKNSSPSTPTLQEENNNVDVHLSIPEGQVSIGKFMYPKKHKAFFDEPMLFKQSNIGTFYMNQVLGNLNARLKQEREAPPKPEPKFHQNDFHNRTFYLTAATHPVNPTFAKLDTRYDEEKAMVDIRVQQFSFHPNNTFSAICTEKILRGRYGITGEEGDRLWLRVSLFGTGRSAPGSVYSEGRLLSHDDRRGYIGRIQAYENKNNQTTLFVEGEFYHGSDWRQANKVNSMGTFTLQEIDVEEADDEDEEEDGIGIGGKEDMDDDPFDDIEDAFQ